jgi:hypothetical protein
MTWEELAKKQPTELSDAERVAIAAVIRSSVHERPRETMDEIFTRLLGEYNHLFSHCDPLPKSSGP